MTIRLFLFILLIFGCLMFSAGGYVQQTFAPGTYLERLVYAENVGKAIDVDQAITFIYECEKRHQYYADRPDECNEIRGSVEFHQGCVEKYRAIIALLRELGEK